MKISHDYANNQTYQRGRIRSKGAGKKIKKPKIKEARVSGNESNNVVDEAINHNNTVKVTYSRDGNKYYRQVEGEKRQKIDSKLCKKVFRI